MNRSTKRHIRNRRRAIILLAGLGSTLVGQVLAQTFTTLYSFTPLTCCPRNNSDGAYPGSLILSSNTLYGTCQSGGSSEDGTVFSINTDGSGFTTLYSFSGLSCCPQYNGDGAWPNGLVLLGNTLYGTAQHGGFSGSGTVFSVNTDSTGFTVVYSFTGTNDGAYPSAGLISSGNTLYGTSRTGGAFWALAETNDGGGGAVFAMNADGTGFTNIYSFTPTSFLGPPYVNTDGGWPSSPLILSDNTLFGTARVGGSSGNGTVFAVNTDGTGFRVLHSFTANHNNTDGGNPNGLILSGNSLYGTTGEAGRGGVGTVFQVNTDGTGFKVLHDFTTWVTNSAGVLTNSDGAQPAAGLILSGNKLYGTGYSGGSSGSGTVFSLDTDGSGFTTLYSFTALDTSSSPYTNSDGAGPNGLILSSNVLYGTTSHGGSGFGTIFSITLPVSPPQVAITSAGANVILSWPTNASGFTLQSTTNFGASAIWTTNLPAPVVVNGQNTVTNPISGTQQFYRLAQ